MSRFHSAQISTSEMGPEYWVLKYFIYFKAFVEFVTILLLFYVFWVLAKRHVRSQLPEEGANPHPLHWKVKSYPLNHQGSPLGVGILQAPHSHS